MADTKPLLAHHVDIRQHLHRGQVIPAHPLALSPTRALDERHQRALTRYYIAAGAGGMAVGVHTTGFPIHDAKIGLYRPVLALTAETANEAKSAVASVFGRKFLGYALWVAKGREVKCKVAEKPLSNFKARIRQLTRRSGGCSMAQVVDKLRPYLLGWKAYFGMAQTPGVWRELDEWLRHRLRAIQLKQWKRPKAIYRELKALGASHDVAQQVAGNCHRWWRNSRGVLNTVLTIAYFDRLGVPRLS